MGYLQLMRDLKGSRAAKAAADEATAVAQAKAATAINAHARGFLTRKRAKQLYDERLALRPLAVQYDLLIDEVREACAALRLRRREECAIYVQSHARRIAATSKAKAMLRERDSQEALSRQYALLIAEVARSAAAHAELMALVEKLLWIRPRASDEYRRRGRRDSSEASTALGL